MNKKKGFTLAELLIVVAIIAVLVGVAIPVFTSQLEKSREAVDLSNLRSAYAECTTAVLTGETTSSDVTAVTDASGAVTGYQKTVKLKQQTDEWTGDNGNAEIGGVKVGSKIKKTSDVTVIVSKDGKVDFTQS